jgi:hypothetical protein
MTGRYSTQTSSDIWIKRYTNDNRFWPLVAYQLV